MHIYFINYHRFEASSGIHIHFLANELVKLGVPCTICVPDDHGILPGCTPPLYEVMSFADLKRKASSDPDGFQREQAILHAWTPREIVRRFVDKLGKQLSIPYFLHLEDNEEQILESHTGVRVDSTGFFAWLRQLILPKAFIHPRRYREFMGKAAGVTCIIDKLQDFVPANVPALTFWPACEPAFYQLPEAADEEMRRSLGISPETVTLTYTGNIHASNLDEVQTLYSSVVELNRRGYDVKLLRCGSTHGKLDEAIVFEAGQYVTELGNLPPEDFIKYIAAADILVQPGRPDHFNDYRFPSKLPMFLASGRPTILPATNIGAHLADGENCILLKEGTVEELVTEVENLIKDTKLRKSIGRNGRSFALEKLNWEKSAQSVLDFYKACLKN